MKKLNKKELIVLLQNKGNQTYKDLSLISGYHEKSLVRIFKQLERGEYSSIHGNIGKIPYNKIAEKKKQELIELYQTSNYSSKREFYLYLCSLGYSYSYSFLTKIIKKKKPMKVKRAKKRYLSISRKTISENQIQYQNKRYSIDTKVPIKHHETVFLFADKETLQPLFIKYHGRKYYLLYQQTVISKKGNTKYS